MHGLTAAEDPRALRVAGTMKPTSTWSFNEEKLEDYPRK